MVLMTFDARSMVHLVMKLRSVPHDAGPRTDFQKPAGCTRSQGRGCRQS